MKCILHLNSFYIKKSFLIKMTGLNIWIDITMIRRNIMSLLLSSLSYYIRTTISPFQYAMKYLRWLDFNFQATYKSEIVKISRFFVTSPSLVTLSSFSTIWLFTFFISTEFSSSPSSREKVACFEALLLTGNFFEFYIFVNAQCLES